MARRKDPGVYLISNKVTNKYYVGSTTRNLNSRWSDHKSQLRTKIHPNIHLQRSWDKHGEFSFEFTVLYRGEDVLENEQGYMDLFFPQYNIQPLARNSAGLKRSPETRVKIGLSKIGNQYCLGRVWTDESKTQISETLKEGYKSGKIVHPFLGSTHTAEARVKISASKKGKPGNRKGDVTYRGFIQLDKDTKLPISRFETAQAAVKAIGRFELPASSKIIRACKKGWVAYGYKWKFDTSK